MKLLDWMQHKFQQTNNEPPTDFAQRNSCSCLMGQPSLDDIEYYPKTNYYTKAPSKTQKEIQFRKSFTCVETARVDDLQTEEETAAAFSQLFHGFLAIGTLAAETITNEPETSAFTTYDGNNIEKETENELKLINDELEKMLETETVKKEKEGTENNENGDVCPLQSYLFGSVIGLQETEAIKKEKEHRTSLGDLFQRTKMVEEHTEAKINRTEKQKEKETEKSAVYLMKRIFKGKTLYSSSRHSTADKKPRKILQMFHRKVHPEGLPVGHKSNQNVKVGSFTEEYKDRNRIPSDDIALFPKVNSSKKSANCTMNGGCINDSDGNKECWIKSDSEYLVLEL